MKSILFNFPMHHKTNQRQKTNKEQDESPNSDYQK